MQTIKIMFSNFEGHGFLKHFPWAAQSPDLNIVELLSSVLEAKLNNTLTPIKHLEDDLQEKIV
jgi:hypothetical protein